MQQNIATEWVGHAVNLLEGREKCVSLHCDQRCAKLYAEAGIVRAAGKQSFMTLRHVQHESLGST